MKLPEVSAHSPSLNLNSLLKRRISCRPPVTFYVAVVSHFFLFCSVLLPVVATAAGPQISSVSPISAEASQTINISGSGFGSQSPYTGDSRYIQITDLTKNWAAGYCDPALNPPENPQSCVPGASPSDAVGLKVTSWTDTSIEIGGFAFHYGENNWTLDTGDQIQVEVWNPQTHAGPAIYTTTVTSAEPQVTDGPGVLYETGTGKGSFEGWSLTPDWKHLTELLLNDGTGSCFSIAPSFAPYKPTSADVVVEAQIQVLKNGCGFGVVVRADGDKGYAAGVDVNGNTYIWYRSGGNAVVEGQAFKPGSEWHTYRVEVKGNTITLSIDNAVMASLIDNRFISAGSVGLWSRSYQLEVQNFKVMAVKK
jgi:hypothetical protein